MMWNRAEAIAMLSLIHQTALHENGYAVNLGGSVLYKGESEKDLDIVCMPSLKHTQNKQGMINMFKVFGFNQNGDHDLYGMEVIKLLDKQDRRIDLIIPKLAED